MAGNDTAHLFPRTARRWLTGIVLSLTAAAVLGYLWRGPALLLDLAAMGRALGCF